MIFTEVTHSDRTNWLEWRHKGIGSSDAAVIMGVSRFKTREQLLIEKATPFTFEDQSNAYIKDRGNKIEVQVRDYLTGYWGEKFTPVNCVMNDIPFFRAALDGAIDDRRVIAEIKLLSTYNPTKPNKKAAGYKKWEAAFHDAKVPPEYYPQIQHQLMVTGAESCLFVGYKEVKGDPKVTAAKLAMVPVLPDKSYITQLATLEFQFWLDVIEYRKKLTYRGELE